jgi:hypothetical protein
MHFAKLLAASFALYSVSSRTMCGQQLICQASHLSANRLQPLQLFRSSALALIS